MTIKVKNVHSSQITVLGVTINSGQEVTISASDGFRLSRSAAFRLLILESKVVLKIDDFEFRDKAAEHWLDLVCENKINEASRKRVSKFVETNANVTIHTVTSGLTFYLTHISINGANTAASTNARVLIRDGANAADNKIPFGWGFDSGKPATITSNINLSDNPEPFVNDVRVVIAAGTVSAAIYIVGYEE